MNPRRPRDVSRPYGRRTILSPDRDLAPYETPPRSSSPRPSTGPLARIQNSVHWHRDAASPPWSDTPRIETSAGFTSRQLSFRRAEVDTLPAESRTVPLKRRSFSRSPVTSAGQHAGGPPPSSPFTIALSTQIVNNRRRGVVLQLGPGQSPTTGVLVRKPSDFPASTSGARGALRRKNSSNL